MRMLFPLSNDWSSPRRNVSPAVVRDFFEDFDQTFGSFLQPIYGNTRTPNRFQSSLDINETDKHYLISFDMPGVKKEDVKIEVKGNLLTLSGERHSELKSDTGNERSYGRFERTFTLPESVDTEKIEAHYDNGVLNVALPKDAEVRTKNIQVQSGQGGFLEKFLSPKKETKDVKDIKIS